MKRTTFVAAMLACVLSSIVSAQTAGEPMPAIVADSAIGGGRQGATFFFVSKIDEQSVSGDALQASRRASAGRGADLRVVGHERAVPAGRRRIELQARHAFSAPVQGIFQSAPGPVSGSIEVELKAGARYRVAGVLDAMRREVWLEELPGGQLVAPKILQAVSDPAVIAAMADAAYTCCNLRYEGDWISDANWADLPLIAAGARIKVQSVSSNRASVLIDGRPMRVGLDFGRGKQSTQQLLDSLMRKDDPHLRIASYPAAVQAAIAVGRVMPGMSREQVTVSLGPPRLDETPSPAADPRWTYRTFGDEPYVLHWTAEGNLDRVEAEASVLARVLHKP